MTTTHSKNYTELCRQALAGKTPEQATVPFPRGAGDGLATPQLPGRWSLLADGRVQGPGGTILTGYSAKAVKLLKGL